MFLAIIWGKYVFLWRSLNIPGLKKKNKGDDAWISSKVLLGVADGVGSWHKRGINPALYSSQLLHNVNKIFPSNISFFNENPYRLMEECIKQNYQRGSSTFLLTTIDQKRSLLKVASLGDSVLLHLRIKGEKYEIALRTQANVKKYNHPAQASAKSWSLEDIFHNDSPLSAGDIVLLGSDGVFDNLFDNIIVEIINKHASNYVFYALQELVELAFYISKKRNIPTPFEINSAGWGKKKRGGKQDDITAILAQIKDDNKK